LTGSELAGSRGLGLGHEDALLEVDGLKVGLLRGWGARWGGTAGESARSGDNENQGKSPHDRGTIHAN
jgi:hypothetical protein